MVRMVALGMHDVAHADGDLMIMTADLNQHGQEVRKAIPTSGANISPDIMERLSSLHRCGRALPDEGKEVVHYASAQASEVR